MDRAKPMSRAVRGQLGGAFRKNRCRIVDALSGDETGDNGQYQEQRPEFDQKPALPGDAANKYE